MRLVTARFYYCTTSDRSADSEEADHEMKEALLVPCKGGAWYTCAHQAWTVNPLARTITPGELSEKEMVLVAPASYDVAHELEHLQDRKITGAGIRERRFA